MKRLKQHMIQTRQRQRGVVAIIVGAGMAGLVGMIGLVVDLGHLYVAKSELQNAADAAALAGAKQLDGTLCGVDSTKGGCDPSKKGAVQFAIEAAGRNNYDLNAKAVTITAAANLWVGDCPDQDRPGDTDTDGCRMVTISSVTTDALAADKTFLKVHTGLQSFNTWFIHVLPGATSIMKTFGMAVAGRYVVDVAPLGVCAVDKDRQEQGFIRGVAYNVMQLNPLGINSDALWVNPVNAPPDTCDDLEPSWNSSSSMVDFVCTGKSVVPRSLPGDVFVNTGTSSSLEKALNSRFDDFQGSSCDMATAPPDVNVKEYRCTNASGSDGCLRNNSIVTGLPRDWMDPTLNSNLPSQQGITIIDRKPIDKTTSGGVRTAPPNPSVLFKDYGVLWSYSREKNFAIGGDHTLVDWGTLPLPQSLYKGDADQTANGYPPPVPAASSPPYFQTSGKYFRAPPNNPTAGVRNRRVLNMLIIDCDAPPSKDCGNKGIALNALAIGKFFMPVKANLPDELFLEFVGAISTLPPADIRLYK